jgi:maleate isomerase
VRIGVLTPSSNTALEPLTQAMAREVAGVSVHFSRFPVTEIALTDAALAQFDEGPILCAAELLSHARVDRIVWSGTSSGWLGFAADDRLCEAITNATGIPATTSMLALNAALRGIGAHRVGLVTPYRDDVQARIVAGYAALGFDCAAERHIGLQDNFSFAEVPEARIAAMVREVAPGADAVAVICTNLHAAHLAAGLERETGVAVFDTVATALWQALLLEGCDPARLAAGWGRLFALGLPAPG